MLEALGGWASQGAARSPTRLGVGWTSSIPWDTPGRVSFRGRPFWIRQGAYLRRSASKNADGHGYEYSSIDVNFIDLQPT
ncbi:MAG: hypothetical protein QXO22_08285 [Thermosphaera sp.]